MRKVQKVLALTGCAALLVVGSVAGTLAYLTSQDDVKNTFTVGEVELDLWEHVVGEDGKATANITHAGNTYDEILPGLKYSKDPTVTVKADSEDCYVRMLVTVTYNENADAVFAKYNYTDWFDWNDDWAQPTTAPKTEKKDGKISRTYEFRYKDVVRESNDKQDLPALFTTISIPGGINNNELNTLDGLTMDVVANAIQEKGFESVDKAWEAFDAQMTPPSVPDDETVAETESV